MTEIQLLTRQTENTYEWTNKLVMSTPFEKWDVIPEVVGTCISWQVGHLVISQYYHSIMVVAGHQKDVLGKIPVKEYSQLFTKGSPENSKGKINSERLWEHLKIVQQKSIEIIRSMTTSQLSSPLEPTRVPHPVASTKFEAIDWNIKHTMYHCGQIGILKRIVDVRYDFGLRMPGEPTNP